MTEEIRTWKTVLDKQLEVCFHGNIAEHHQEVIQEAYEYMIQKSMERDKMLNIYRQEYLVIKQAYQETLESLRQCEALIHACVEKSAI